MFGYIKTIRRDSYQKDFGRLTHYRLVLHLPRETRGPGKLTNTNEQSHKRLFSRLWRQYCIPPPPPPPPLVVSDPLSPLLSFSFENFGRGSRFLCPWIATGWRVTYAFDPSPPPPPPPPPVTIDTWCKRFLIAFDRKKYKIDKHLYHHCYYYCYFYYFRYHHHHHLST